MPVDLYGAVGIELLTNEILNLASFIKWNLFLLLYHTIYLQTYFNTCLQGLK